MGPVSGPALPRPALLVSPAPSSVEKWREKCPRIRIAGWEPEAWRKQASLAACSGSTRLMSLMGRTAFVKFSIAHSPTQSCCNAMIVDRHWHTLAGHTGDRTKTRIPYPDHSVMALPFPYATCPHFCGLVCLCSKSLLLPSPVIPLDPTLYSFSSSLLLIH